MIDPSGRHGGHLLDFLIEKHMQRGEIVYTDFLETGQSPEGWSGPFPDLIAKRDSSYLAICIESFTDQVGEDYISKWKSILNNPKTTLQIIVRNRKSCDFVKQAAALHNIPLECKIIIKKAHSKRNRYNGLFNMRSILRILFLFLVVSFIVVMLK
ncbi:MAG: hypothetical protein Q8O92_12595 [Candidatus Latescibacter sp.]|nr:hypothetical protein [Candidatus Latescibacter sp.]